MFSSNKYKKYTGNSLQDNYNFSCYDANQSFQQIPDISELPIIQEKPNELTKVNNNNLFSLQNIPYPTISTNYSNPPVNNNVNPPPSNNVFNFTSRHQDGHHM